MTSSIQPATTAARSPAATVLSPKMVSITVQAPPSVNAATQNAPTSSKPLSSQRSLTPRNFDGVRSSPRLLRAAALRTAAGRPDAYRGRPEPCAAQPPAACAGRPPAPSAGGAPTAGEPGGWPSPSAAAPFPDPCGRGARRASSSRSSAKTTCPTARGAVLPARPEPTPAPTPGRPCRRARPRSPA